MILEMCFLFDSETLSVFERGLLSVLVSSMHCTSLPGSEGQKGLTAACVPLPKSVGTYQKGKPFASVQKESSSTCSCGLNAQ